MLRNIVKIDESKCDGCGDCIPACAEGALQIIDGKARLISDLFCDGLGACLGHCPQGAITVEEREAEPYNEKKVMETIAKGGKNVIKAHLEHLKEHGETRYYQQAIEYLKENEIEIPIEKETVTPESNQACGCPGSQTIDLRDISNDGNREETGDRTSHLQQWPIQLHLVSPLAAYYRNSNLLLAADCVGFSYPDFHKDFLKDKTIAIACPKLDTNQEAYLQKLAAMINQTELKSITVLVMQVPCCSGLVQLAQKAVEISEKSIPLKAVVIGLKVEILKEVDLTQQIMNKENIN
ncbi:MAG: 4Fe-4S binding protein [Bacteroidales bacterium]|nr:4Fe-4S binding protein [Bacteroidales bacterium]